MLSSHVLDLLALLADHVSSVLELSINELFVLNVDERAKVDGKSGDQGKAPKWNELDQEVGDKGGDKSLEIISVRRSEFGCRASSRTKTVAQMFSANRTRWNSMTKKLMNCSTSSRRRSRDSLGMVKYLRGRMRVARPSPKTALPKISAPAVTYAVSLSMILFVFLHLLPNTMYRALNA